MKRSLTAVTLLAVALVLGCTNANIVGGRNYVKQSEWDKAVRILESASREMPNDPEVHYLLGLSYVKSDSMRRADEEPGRKGSGDTKNRYEKAAAELSRASELDPVFYKLRADTIQSDVYAELFNAGSEFLGAGQYEQALGRYEDAVLFRADEKAVHQNLGFVYSKLGRRDDAIRAYRTMYNLDRNDLDGLRLVLSVLSDAGQRGEAYSIAKEILASKPGDLQILGLLSDLYYEDADSAKAHGDVATERQKLREIIPLYKAVIDADPTKAEAVYQLGLVHYRLEEYAEAATYFENTLDIEGADERLLRDALYNLAVSLYKNKQYVFAELRFRDLIAMEPNECEHYRLLRATLQEQKRSNEALDVARQYEQCTKGQ